MASNLHKDLSDSQLHYPKGFATASNSTQLTKNASGNLEWATATAGGVTSIIQGSGILISPNTGVGDVTISANVIPTLICQSFRGCAEYIAPTDPPKGSTMSNLIARQLGCREMRYSDFYHGTDFGTSTLPFACLPQIIIGGSEMTISVPSNLVVFEGNIYSSSNTTINFVIAMARPNCETASFFEVVEVGSVSINAKKGAVECFKINPAVTLQAKDVLIPLIQMDNSNQISY